MFLGHTIWDKVYNTTEMDIEVNESRGTTPTNEAGSGQLVRQGKTKAEKGTLEVVFTDSSGEVIFIHPSFVTMVTTKDVVEGEFNASYNGLPFGTYTAKITLIRLLLIMIGEQSWWKSRSFTWKSTSKSNLRFII